MSRKDIEKIVELIENNAKSVFANPIVTIVIIAVIILPQACLETALKQSIRFLGLS